MSNNIVVITAPSAAGKTTLIKKYVSNFDNVSFSVSHTTRNKREGEVDGVDYYFIDKEKFNEMIENNEFIEWASVHDNYYGTSLAEINKPLEKNNILILDIDVQGALFLKSREIKAKYIFIMPPSIEAIKERLIKRNTETEESLKRRIWDAKREMEYANKFDYIVENSDLEVAYENLVSIINDKKKTGTKKEKASKTKKSINNS